MCLLTFLPENVDFDYERARVSAQSFMLVLPLSKTMIWILRSCGCVGLI